MIRIPLETIITCVGLEILSQIQRKFCSFSKRSWLTINYQDALIPILWVILIQRA